MRAFRRLIIVLLLLCLAPVLSLTAAGLIARQAGCDLDVPPANPVPCTVLGGDYGDSLFALSNFGWYAVGTIPLFGALLAVWLIVEIVRGASGRSRKPRPPLPSETAAYRRKVRQPPAPAASRNRVRGS